MEFSENKEQAKNEIIEHALKEKLLVEDIESLTDEYNRNHDGDLDVKRIMVDFKLARYEKLNGLILNYLHHQQTIKELTKVIDELKPAIKVELKENNLTFYEDIHQNSVSYKMHSRETLDKKKVKELLGEIRFKEVVKSTQFEMLKITCKESRDKIKAVLEGKK